jgi:hypothetical protein
MGHDVRAILDTSVVIATDVGPLEGELAISSATLAELHFGVLVATTAGVRAERLRRLSVLQRTFDALPVDEAVAASYGQRAAAMVDAERRPRARTHHGPAHRRHRACPLRAGLHAQRGRLRRCERTGRGRHGVIRLLAVDGAVAA